MTYSVVFCLFMAWVAIKVIHYTTVVIAAMKKTRTMYVRSVDDGLFIPSSFLAWCAAQSTRTIEMMGSVIRPVAIVGLIYTAVLFLMLYDNNWTISHETQFLSVIALAPTAYFFFVRPNIDWYVQWDRTVLIEQAEGRLMELNELIRAIESGEEAVTDGEMDEILRVRSRLQAALARLD